MKRIFTAFFLSLLFQCACPTIITMSRFQQVNLNVNATLQEKTTNENDLNEKSVISNEISIKNNQTQLKNTNEKKLVVQKIQIANQIIYTPSQIGEIASPILVYEKKRRISPIISQDSIANTTYVIKKQDSVGNRQNVTSYVAEQLKKMNNQSLIDSKQAPAPSLQQKSQTKSNQTIISSNKTTLAPSVSQISRSGGKQILNQQFNGIGLFHSVPHNYKIGETYRFNGILLDYQYFSQFKNKRTSNFLNIVFTEWNGKNQFRCLGEIEEPSLQFYISCKMKYTGKYFLSIFFGPSGQSSLQFRFISNDFSTQIKPGQLSQPPKPEKVRLDVIKNNLQISWASKAAITNITFFQKRYNITKRVEYILANYHQKFRVPFKDFQDFQRMYVQMEVTHANSMDGTYYELSSKFSKNRVYGQFFALQHQFDSMVGDKVSISPPIPWKIGVDKKIRIQAIFQDDVRNQVFLISPNLNIKRVYFVQSDNKKIPVKIIKAGTVVTLQISFSTPGTHLIEINSVSGTALLNRPIYVGNGFPLIPDYEDLILDTYSDQYIQEQLEMLSKYYNKKVVKSQIKQPSLNSTLQEKRQFVLLLINDLRKKYGAEPVQMDNQLNNFSQFHSDDMSNKKYFNHISLEGNGPQQRAILFNITRSIGENIAQSYTLIQGVLGFERSATRLQNSVSSQWSRLGIGISRTESGQYIVVLQFSTRNLKQKPLNKDQIKAYQKQLVKIIQQQNRNIKAQNKDLSDEISLWMDTQRQKHVFEFLFDRKDYSKLMVLFSFKAIFKDYWIKQLRQNSDFLQGYQKYNEVGVGLGLDPYESNTIEIYLIFS